MKTRSMLFVMLSTLALAANGQTPVSSGGAEYAVADRGAFWRTWQRTERLTNSLTGAIVDNVAQYTELGDGLCYRDERGQWLDSQDLIEIAPTGAAAVHGQAQAYFLPNLNTPNAITLRTPSQVFQSHPIGLYYRDMASGKVALIGPVQDTIGVLVPPNQVVYSNAFSGLKASVVYAYAKNGFDQSVVLMEAPASPDILAGFNPATSRLEVWTALDEWPGPQKQRAVVLKQGASPQLNLVDHLLFFADSWLPVGAAFVVDDANVPTPGEPAPVRLADPDDTNNVLVAKSIEQIGDQNVLVESVNYEDLLPKLKTLRQAALPGDGAKAKREVAQGRQLPPVSSTKSVNRPLQLASAGQVPLGLVLDYVHPLSGSAGSFTFSNGWTYIISNSFSVGTSDGTVTFQNNTCVKYASNAYLLASSPYLSFPSSGTPPVFTSKDDNAYGEAISGSSGLPYYAAAKELMVYYPDSGTTIQNARFRWAQIAVRYDQSSGANYSHYLNNSTFANHQTTIYLNLPSGALYLSGDTVCNSPTSVSGSGYVYGSLTTDCGVVSVARVNDPGQDTASGDPNKNSQSECSFVVFNTTNIVAAFFDTHRSEYQLGYNTNFTGIISPRATSWAVSTNGGASFTESGPIPPSSPTNKTQGDAGDPSIVRDTSSGTIYLLVNPARHPDSWLGLRLWKSTDNGQSFSLLNTNVPGGITWCDKSMLAVNNFSGLTNSGHLYVAAASLSGGGIFASHSANGGTSWDAPQTLSTNGAGADVTIRPDGTVYVFYLAYTNSGGPLQTRIQYNWLRVGQTNWNGPATLKAHTDTQFLYSTNGYGSGQLPRSNSADSLDYFISDAFPRLAVNPVNGRVYVVYADLPYAGSTTDHGDIFVQEGTPNADDSITNWSGAIKVNNDRTTTDQWDPSIAVNPAGTGLFIGHYSRQSDPNTNAWIKAYGAKANISSGLVGATFDTFPISSVALTNLFPGTLTSTPSTSPWLFDNVWVQQDVYLNTNAMVVSYNTGILSSTDYVNFAADDYTWANADGSYFYFAWCDRSDSCSITNSGTVYNRADPNIRLGKIKQ